MHARTGRFGAPLVGMLKVCAPSRCTRSESWCASSLNTHPSPAARFPPAQPPWPGVLFPAKKTAPLLSFCQSAEGRRVQVAVVPGLCVAGDADHEVCTLHDRRLPVHGAVARVQRLGAHRIPPIPSRCRCWSTSCGSRADQPPGVRGVRTPATSAPDPPSALGTRRSGRLCSKVPSICLALKFINHVAVR